MQQMQLGNFSVSLAVKDIDASRQSDGNTILFDQHR